MAFPQREFDSIFVKGVVEELPRVSQLSFIKGKIIHVKIQCKNTFWNNRQYLKIHNFFSIAKQGQVWVLNSNKNIDKKYPKSNIFKETREELIFEPANRQLLKCSLLSF